MRYLLAVLVGALLALAPASAQAADLLLLQGDTAEIGGMNNYGFVYVDGALRLSADTGITAGSVYFGPNATIDTCFVPGTGAGTGNNQCVNGRSLTINSTGPVVLTPGLDLTGGQGPIEAGGGLNISGAGVTVGGAITTSGVGGATSGPVTIASSAGLDVGATITALSAPVKLAAAGDLQVGGDISTIGTASTPLPVPYQAQGGGVVDVSSSGGDVAIAGNIAAAGRDQGAGGLYGGNAAPVTLSGGNVRVGNVDTTGGTSTDHDPGSTAPISLAARGSANVLGRLDASGQNSTSSAGTSGSSISITAGGQASISGGATVQGGSGIVGGAAGSIGVTAGSALLTTLSAFGGNAASASNPGAGGAGGAIKVAATGPVSAGALQAFGGNGQNGMQGGGGGAIDVSGAPVSATQVSTAAGTSPGAVGASGGHISLSSGTSLHITGSIVSTGANGAGSVAPARPGGAAGSILLRAAAGTLTLGGSVLATGGTGGPAPTANLGGTGGAGGRLDVVAQTLGSFVSLSTHGGTGGGTGDLQGPGGAGGTVHAWTDGTIFDDQRVVDADGGDGGTLGATGAKVQESSPTGPAISADGVFSFASHSPGAEGFQILRSVAGAAATVAATTTATSAIKTSAPMCVPVTFTVQAFHSGVGWDSATPAPVAYIAQPSATQKCVDPPGLAARSTKIKFKLRTLRKAKWHLSVALTAKGVGALDASLLKRKVKKALWGSSTKLDKPGQTKLRVSLPKRARHTGRYTLRLVTTAPDGKAKATTNLNLEVKR